MYLKFNSQNIEITKNIQFKEKKKKQRDHFYIKFELKSNLRIEI